MRQDRWPKSGGDAFTATAAVLPPVHAQQEFENVIQTNDIVFAADYIHEFVLYNGNPSSDHHSSESRRYFYENFPLILSRIFGEGDVCRACGGGWLQIMEALMLNTPSEPSSSSLTSSSTTSSASTSIPGATRASSILTIARGEILRAAMKLLSCGKDVEGSIAHFAFTALHPVEFKFDCGLLPLPTQWKLARQLSALSPLYTRMLATPVQEQANALNLRNPYLMLNIAEYFIFLFLRYPVSRSKCSIKPGDLPSSIGGRPRPNRPYSPTCLDLFPLRYIDREGLSAILRGSPYDLLLLEYLCKLGFNSGLAFPAGSVGVQGPQSRGSKRSGSVYGTYGPNSPFRLFFLNALIEFWLGQNVITYNPDSPPFSNGLPTSSASNRSTVGRSSGITEKAWHEQGRLLGQDGQAIGDRREAPVSHTLPVYPLVEYTPPSREVLRSLATVLVFLLSDRMMPVPLQAQIPEATTAQHYRRIYDRDSSYSGQARTSGAWPPIPLSPSLRLLQRPLFEFLRLAFVKCPLGGASSSTFHGSVELWLCYLQPWHARTWLGTSASAINPDVGDYFRGLGLDSSGRTLGKLSREWISFVAFNFHFYSTLLGHFIQRFRELPFTSGADGWYDLKLLMKVMAVFSPELLDVLETLNSILTAMEKDRLEVESQRPGARGRSSGLGGGSDWGRGPRCSVQPSAQRRRREYRTYSPLVRTEDFLEVEHLLLLHCDELGLLPSPVAPAHYERDAELLIDALATIRTTSTVNHRPAQAQGGSGAASNGFAGAQSPGSVKEVYDWLHHRVADITSEAVTALKGSQAVTVSVQKFGTEMAEVRRVFGVPDNYVSASSLAAGGGQVRTVVTQKPMRRRRFPFLLSDDGQADIRDGRRRCNNSDAVYVGDPLQRPVASYELAPLVLLATFLSKFCNRAFGLETQREKLAAGDPGAMHRAKGGSRHAQWPRQSLSFSSRAEASDDKEGFRFDFRWIADVGNLCFACGLGFILFCIIKLAP